MTLFGLVRHGQTDYNLKNLFQGSSDIPLNATGREQAHHALDHVPDISWDVVVSSPLLRARQTAQIIAEDHDIPLGPTDARLSEIDWGAAEGHVVEEMEARYPGRSFPGAEEPQVVADRGYDALESLEQEFPGQNVLVVAHGTIIRFLVSGIAERALDSVPNGTLSILTLEGTRWGVEMVAGHREENLVRVASREQNPRFVVEHRHLTPGADRPVDAVSATDPLNPRTSDEHPQEKS